MINKQKALDDFQISEKELDEMLSEFVVQADDTINAIEKKLGEGKVHEAERCAHSLKGVSGNLRLDECFRIATILDDYLKKNESAPAVRILGELKKAVEEVRGSIRG